MLSTCLIPKSGEKSRQLFSSTKPQRPKRTHSFFKPQSIRITVMSEGRDSAHKLLGKTIQSSDDQQRKYFKGVQAYRYEGYETDYGKSALANLRANPAAMSRSMKFHETS